MSLGRQLAGLQVKADVVLPLETEATPDRGAAPPPAPCTGDTIGPEAEETFQEGVSLSPPRPPRTSSSPPTGSPSCTVNTVQKGPSPHTERLPSLSPGPSQHQRGNWDTQSLPLKGRAINKKEDRGKKMKRERVTQCPPHKNGLEVQETLVRHLATCFGPSISLPLPEASWP